MNCRKKNPKIGHIIDRNHIAYLVESARASTLTWYDGYRTRHIIPWPNTRSAGQDLVDAAQQGANYCLRRLAEPEEEQPAEQPFIYIHPDTTSFTWDPKSIANAIIRYEWIAAQDPAYVRTPAYPMVQGLKEILVQHLARPVAENGKIPQIIPDEETDQ